MQAESGSQAQPTAVASDVPDELDNEAQEAAQVEETHGVNQDGRGPADGGAAADVIIMVGDGDVIRLDERGGNDINDEDEDVDIVGTGGAGMARMTVVTKPDAVAQPRRHTQIRRLRRRLHVICSEDDPADEQAERDSEQWPPPEEAMVSSGNTAAGGGSSADPGMAQTRDSDEQQGVDQARVAALVRSLLQTGPAAGGLAAVAGTTAAAGLAELAAMLPQPSTPSAAALPNLSSGAQRSAATTVQESRSAAPSTVAGTAHGAGTAAEQNVPVQQHGQTAAILQEKGHRQEHGQPGDAVSGPRNINRQPVSAAGSDNAGAAVRNFTAAVQQGQPGREGSMAGSAQGTEWKKRRRESFTFVPTEQCVCFHPYKPSKALCIRQQVLEQQWASLPV